MPHPFPRLAAAVPLLLLAVGFARAQETEPPTPADLVRGLRTAGMPDLALEYLKDATATAPAAAQTLLILERGRLQVELAGQEPDAVKREEYTSAAAADFKLFQEKAPNHPRGAEAAAALAQMLSLQAYTGFQRAYPVTQSETASPEAKLAAASDLAKVREQFRQAGVQFAKAVDRLTATATTAEGSRKKELIRELLQTKLDAAINQYKLGRATENDQVARGKHILAAYKGQSGDTKTGRPAVDGFDTLSREDATQPACQIARAWIGECFLETDSKKEALDVFTAILADHRRLNTEATRAGYRMARFFDLRKKLDTANTPAENKAVADAAEGWLNEFRGRTTAETYAVQYFRARALFDQARGQWSLRKEAAEKAKPPQVYVPSADANLVQSFRAAEAEFRKLLVVDSEYTQRATTFRNVCLRVIVGDTVKPPAEYKTFDECHMAALVLYQKINEAKDEERPAAVATTLGLLERARTLPVPAESAREAQTSQLMLISVYRMSGRPAEAAILADFAMRGTKTATTIARFGGQALGAYLDSAQKVPGTDPVSKRVDLDRALTVAAFLDKSVPADPVAEEARLILAAQYNQDGKPLEAFDLFAKVTPKATRYTLARQLEGRTAYYLIRPLPAEHPDTKKRPELKADKRAEIYNRAVADLGAVPKPISDDAPSAEALPYLEIRLQLAQLHVAAGGDACVTADQMAQATRATAATFKNLKPDEREGIFLQADLVRIDAVYEQARVLTKAEKFKEAADKLAPVLADVVNAGPAVKEGQSAEIGRLAERLDKSRLSYAVVPALNARVREGDIVKATELLDLLKKLGGDARRVMQAVFEVAQGSRPQIEAMRKGGRNEEANKLSGAVAQLIAKVADEKNLTPRDNLNLGQAFFQLGDLAKANEILARVPRPADPEFLKKEIPEPKKEPGESDEDFKKRSDAWRVSAIEQERWRIAALDRVRAMRLWPDLKGAGELLDEMMGPEVENPKKKGEMIRTGLFSNRMDYRREAILFDEAKAAATDPAKATPAWAKAIAGWTKLNSEAIGVLKIPEPKEPQAAAALRQRKETIAKPQYFDTFYEKSRCQLAAFRAVNKNNAKGLESGIANLSRNILGVEKANPTDFNRDAHLKLAELLDANPDLKKKYTDDGGKLLLAKPATDN